MSFALRPYQQSLIACIYQEWQSGKKYVCAVLPTGGGKTVCFGSVIAASPVNVCAIAHRQELVGQISLALAKYNVRHNIIAPPNVCRTITSMHMDEYGKSFYDPRATHSVAGVDTLINRGGDIKAWAATVGLWVQDECHHVLRTNKWGKAAALFPHAYGLGVTATPCRADGKGLGDHADGMMQAIVEGPTMRDLINDGYLTDYRIFAPPSNLDMSAVATGATGDYTRPGMVTAVRESTVMGDVVAHYLKIARGKLGITFATDVQTASDIAEAFRKEGVPAEVVSAKTPDRERNHIIRRFKRRELLQLVNVDLFGEGFDLPALEVVSMARPTQSYALFAQQFGRALRIMEGKDTAIIIDHVGNVMRHGLPDAPRTWTLNAREKKSRSAPDDVIPCTSCPACTAVYERTHVVCPYCGYKPEPVSRSGPEFVDGDLFELDASTLASMRGEVARIDAPAEEVRRKMLIAGNSELAAAGAAKNHRRRQEAQQTLRDAIAWWAAHRRASGQTDAESYRRFYLKFGVDVLSAQTLGRREAEELTERIVREMM